MKNVTKEEFHDAFNVVRDYILENKDVENQFCMDVMNLFIHTYKEMGEENKYKISEIGMKTGMKMIETLKLLKSIK